MPWKSKVAYRTVINHLNLVKIQIKEWDKHGLLDKPKVGSGAIGVSIPCQPVTPSVCLTSTSGTQNNQ
jgi:hypothetical protein